MLDPLCLHPQATQGGWEGKEQGEWESGPRGPRPPGVALHKVPTLLTLQHICGSERKREREVKAGSPLHLLCPCLTQGTLRWLALPPPVSSRCALSCPSRLALAAVSSSSASRSFTISMRRRSASCSCACCLARACCWVCRTSRWSSCERHEGSAGHRAEEEGRNHQPDAECAEREGREGGVKTGKVPNATVRVVSQLQIHSGMKKWEAMTATWYGGLSRIVWKVPEYL